MVEVLVTFGVFLTEVGKFTDRDFFSVLGRVTLIDKRDSVTERAVEDMSDIVWFHFGTPFLDLDIETPC